MAINYNETTKITKPLYLADSKAIDIKITIASALDKHDILFPYKGMQFYIGGTTHAWQKVDSVKDGYLVYASGAFSHTQPSGTEFTDWEVVPDLYIDLYSPLSEGGGGGGGTGVLTIANTPSPETNTVFNAAYGSAAHGDSVVDLTKAKLFTKTNMGWFSTDITVLADDNIIPSLLPTEVQPFK